MQYIYDSFLKYYGKNQSFVTSPLLMLSFYLGHFPADQAHGKESTVGGDAIDGAVRHHNLLDGAVQPVFQVNRSEIRLVNFKIRFVVFASDKDLSFNVVALVVVVEAGRRFERLGRIWLNDEEEKIQEKRRK